MDERYFKNNFRENENFTRWYTEEEIRAFEALPVRSSLVGDKDAYEMANNGDFSKFEQLSEAARIYLASKHMLKNYGELYRYVMDNYDKEDVNERDTSVPVTDLIYAPDFMPDIKDEEYKNIVHNPLVRLAISVKTKNPVIRKEFMELDSSYNREVMRETLNPIEPDEFNAVRRDGKTDSDYNESSNEERKYSDSERAVEETADNIDKQVTLAKLMLLAHIGDCYTRDENSDSAERKEYTGDVANLFAHCSRVSVILPTGKDNGVIDAIMGKNRGEAAGIYKRTAATHDVQPRKYDRNGNITQEYKEIKSKITTFSNQYGMDVPIGGLGKGGIPGEEKKAGIIKGDGTCGHLYIHAHEGSQNECGAMLFGFESDSPSAEGNQQGHTHSMRIPPIGEKMSSFCAQRSDEFGAKYGGRIIDLSKVNPRELSNLLEEFEEIYRGLQVKAVEKGNEDNLKRKLLELNKELCGEILTPGVMAKELCSLGVNWQNVRDVMKEKSGVREEDVWVRNADVINVERIRQPEKSDKERYEEYRRNMCNSIRRRYGMTEVRKAPDSYTYKENEERFNKILTRLMDEGMNDSESYGMPYNNARPEDRQYLADADAAIAMTDNLSEILKPVGRAIAEEMKNESENIARESMRIFGLGRMIPGTRSEMRALPENLRKEFAASAQAFQNEAIFNKAKAESNYGVLNKVMLAIEGKQNLNLTLGEEEYLKSFLSKKGIDYEKEIKGKKFKEALPENEKTVNIGNSLGMDSLEKWKNAPDIILRQVFKNNFASDKNALEQASMLGYDIYDTIFIYDKESRSSKSFREYYRNDLENKEALFMRQLLNREITADVVNFNSLNEVHAATIKIHSEFSEKEPTRWQKFTNNIPETENELYGKVMDEEAKNRRSWLKSVMKPNNERINRGSKRRILEYTEENISKEETLFEREIKESVARGKNFENYNEDEINVNMHEVQLYMLSKGMNMADIMKLGAKKEEKERLAAEYFDLKSDPESKEYKNALEGMKSALASAALPGGNLGNSDNIINNLDQITWLKKASDLFVKESGGSRKDIEENTVNRGIRNINMITEAQLEYMKYFKSYNYINNSHFGDYSNDSYMRSKLFLESCSLDNNGSFYSTVNTENYEYILSTELMEHQVIQRKTLDWLSDKAGRDILIKRDDNGKPYIDFISGSNYYSKCTPEGKTIYGSKDEYMLKRDIRDRERTESKFYEIKKDAEKLSKEKENEIFSEVMNLSTEKFLNYDVAAAAEKEAEKINSGFKDRYEVIMEMVDDYNRGYICNSDIRNRSRIINRRSGDKDFITNGGFNAFPAFTEEEKQAYEEMTGKVKERAEDFKKQAQDFGKQIQEKMKERISEKLKSDMKKTGRQRILNHLSSKSDKDFRKDMREVLNDYIDPSDMSEKFDFVNSEKDIKSYLKNHRELKKDYEEVLKKFNNLSQKPEKGIQDRKEGLKKCLIEESQKTPMLKEIYERDAEYVIEKNKEAHEKYLLGIKKYVLSYCTAKKMGLKKAEKIEEAEAVDKEEIKTAKEVPVPEIPEPEKEAPVIKANDIEIINKQSLENALRIRENEFRAVETELREEIHKQEQRMNKLDNLRELQPSEFGAEEVKDFMKKRKAFIDERIKKEKTAEEEARKEADKAEHKFKQKFIAKAKRENPDMSELKNVKYIKDIEKLSNKWNENLKKLREEKKGSSEYEEAEKKAQFYTKLAQDGRTQANEENKAVYNKVMAEKKREIQNKLYSKYYETSLDSIEAEYEMREQQSDEYRAALRREREKYEADIAVIREKGKEYIEPEKPVKTYRLADFVKSPEQMRKESIARKRAEMAKQRENEPKPSITLKEFLTPRHSGGK